jgi:hypothetical protein
VVGIVRPGRERVLRPADPPANDFIMRNAMGAQEIALGWWPGHSGYPRAAFYAYAHPAPEGFETATLFPSAARWAPELGEYILDWDDVVSAPDPFAAAFAFARSALDHGCAACEWDPALAGSLAGSPPPVRYATVHVSLPCSDSSSRNRRQAWRTSGA